MDALVDEIDEVLEENAEEFVKNYVQRGGRVTAHAEPFSAAANGRMGGYEGFALRGIRGGLPGLELLRAAPERGERVS